MKHVGSVFPYERRTVTGPSGLRELEWSHSVTSARPQSFRASYETIGFARMRLARFHVGDVTVARDPSWRERDPWGATLYFIARGTTTWEVAGSRRPIVAKEGEAIALLSDSLFAGHAAGEASLLQIALPYGFVQERGLELMSGRHLRFEASATTLAARSLFASVCGHLHDMSQESAAFVRRAAEELVHGMILEGVRDREPRHHAAEIRSRAFEFINANHTRPGLTTPDIADAAAVSVRHLHRCFAEVGTSIAAEVARRRTETAVALLTDAAQASLPLGTVARLSGFGSVQTLSRQLRARAAASADEARRVGRMLRDDVPETGIREARRGEPAPREP